MSPPRLRLIKAAVAFSAVVIVIAIALLILAPPNHLFQLRPFAVKEEVHFMAMPGGQVMREDVLFLHNLSPEDIDRILVAEYPAARGWQWSGVEDVGSAQRGEESIIYVPTDIATDGTSDAPPGSDMMVIEVLHLNQGQLFWERVKRHGNLKLEK